jgi:hypothetical protein
MEQPGLHRLHAAAVPDRPALIFHHEIGHLLGTEVEAPAMPADTHAPTWTTCWPWPRPYPDRVVQFASPVRTTTTCGLSP